MSPEAQTPEELETLLEDAFLVRDHRALVSLFENGAVLGAVPERAEARGVDQIARFVAALWERDLTYLADLRRVVQARDTALVLGSRGVHVAHRGRGGGWSYAISLLEIDNSKGDRQ
jgi:hypothetical protein